MHLQVKFKNHSCEKTCCDDTDASEGRYSVFAIHFVTDCQPTQIDVLKVSLGPAEAHPSWRIDTPVWSFNLDLGSS